MNCLGTPQHKNSNITSRSTSETVALLLKLPTVPPRLLSYHSWIISPPLRPSCVILRPSCVILLRLPAGTLRWLPQTNSRYFSINPNVDYLCAGDFLEEYLKASPLLLALLLFFHRVVLLLESKFTHKLYNRV